MVKRFFLLFFIIFFFTSLNVSANESVGKCRSIKWKEGKIYEVKSKMYQGTHITMPENLMQQPICSNELWETEANQNHIFIQPTSAHAKGKNATMTVITSSNTSYHFALTRIDEGEADTCINLKRKSAYFKKNEFSNYKTPGQTNTAILSRKIGELKAALNAQEQLADQKVDDALKKYRSYIYTRYDWKDNRIFSNKKLISDVYDDGRFTYIRTYPNNRGLLALFAEIDGKKEMIEYKIDSDDIYKISGIYDKFFLKYGKTKYKVNRLDDLNNGVY